jgi:hypothetical protein
MEAAHPSLFLRYGAEGKRRCTEDTIYHVLHLAAALEVHDPGEFRRYRAWLAELLIPRGIPQEDIDLNLRVLSEELRTKYGAAAEEACAFLE